MKSNPIKKRQSEPQADHLSQ